ncbi:MAG: NrfJ-related protein [Sterolibacterium sp.]|nr:NrfJ-related protein [Sterolibacterium sp.]
MKSHSALLVLAVFSAAAIAADVPPGHPAMDAKKPAQTAPAAQLPQKGKVLNVINVPQYTYLEVAQDKKTLWVAAPTVTVKKGDMVRFAEGMLMTNFHSNTLNRDFPIISFVDKVVVAKE